MKNFTKYLTEKNYSQNSVNRFTYAAQRLLDWLEMRHVLPQHVTYNRLLTYIKTLKKKGQSPRYVNHQLSAIRHYFDYLIANEMIPHNPAADLHLKGVPRRLPHHLLSEKQLLKCYQNYSENKPLEREIIGLMVFQGLRQREISHLTAQDFDLKNNTVFVCGDARTAGRTLPLSSHQITSLKRYLKDRIYCCEQPIKPLMNRITPYLKSQENLHSIHQLRASVIAQWVNQYNLRKAQYLAGHKYISSTERYQKANPEALQKALEQFHPMQ